MSPFHSLLASPFCIVLLASCAGAPQQLPPVAPGQLFQHKYINVRAPNSDGWRLKEPETPGIGFFKRAQTPKESLGARLLVFDLEPTETPEQFVALIKQAGEEGTDPKRLEILERSTDYTSERGYPCVRDHVIANDKQARTSAITREQQVLEWHGLYCRHPVLTKKGFGAVYSYRGRSRYPGLLVEAEEFISGIQVP